MCSVLSRAGAGARAGARSELSGSGETGQHGDDTLAQLERRRQDGGFNGFAAEQDVKDRRRLGRSAPRHSVEALLLVPREFAGAFGDVEDDRGGRAIERVLEVGASRRQEVVDLVDEVERAGVDVEFGVVSW